MPLDPEPRVPHVCTGEVVGLDGSKVLCQVHDSESQGVLVAQDKDRVNMARVPLGVAGWLALLALATDMVRRLVPADLDDKTP